LNSSLIGVRYDKAKWTSSRALSHFVQNFNPPIHAMHEVPHDEYYVYVTVDYAPGGRWNQTGADNSICTLWSKVS